MKTRVYTQGQNVLPGPSPRRLGIDALTGLPVLTADRDTPVLRGKEVEDLLANFP